MTERSNNLYNLMIWRKKLKAFVKNEVRYNNFRVGVGAWLWKGEARVEFELGKSTYKVV